MGHKRRLKGVKKQIVAISLLCILCFSLGYAVNSNIFKKHGVAKAEANLFIFAETVEGIYKLSSGNVITDIGENRTRIYHSRNQSATQYALYWISIGNVTAGTAKTQLDSEFDRKKGEIVEWTNAGDYALNCTYKFNFASANVTDGAGLHWESSGDNNLYACANYAQTSWAINDNCTIVWTITFNAN